MYVKKWAYQGFSDKFRWFSLLLTMAVLSGGCSGDEEACPDGARCGGIPEDVYQCLDGSTDEVPAAELALYHADLEELASWVAGDWLADCVGEGYDLRGLEITISTDPAASASYQYPLIQKEGYELTAKDRESCSGLVLPVSGTVDMNTEEISISRIFMKGYGELSNEEALTAREQSNQYPRGIPYISTGPSLFFFSDDGKLWYGDKHLSKPIVRCGGRK